MELIALQVGSRESSIVVGRDCFTDSMQRIIAVCGTGQVAVVTAPPIRRRYATAVCSRLRQTGIKPVLISVTDGERAKSLRWASTLYDRLIQARFERGATLVALGGGVIGDLTGFVASTYLRGINFVQMPTTLVAQVDASIGGKTGVNHPKGKNLIGTFYQPRLVVIDVATLRTLPTRELVGGMAEVVKYGVIADPGLFEYVDQHVDAVRDVKLDALEQIVIRSARIKADVVGKDEREAGLRRILNYGHTLGHAIETAAGYGRLHHGEAIAIGMEFACRLAVRLRLCDALLVDRQRRLLNRLGLPTTLPSFVTIRSLLSSMTLDKKVQTGRLHFVLPVKLGHVVVEPVGFDVVKDELSAFARH
jgi:3-dehydroquinate synthase